MRIKLALISAVAAMALLAPMTGHALTRVADCTVTSANFGTTACATTFQCPVHTIHLRAIPAFSFSGIVHVSVTYPDPDPLAPPGSTVTATSDSEWLTGRIQIDGDEFVVVQGNPYQSCDLSVSTEEGSFPEPVSGGSATGIVEA